MKNLFSFALTALLAITLIIPSTVSAQKKLKGKEEVVIISTSMGEMYVRLYDLTPKHKENFLKLVKEGFFDGTTFHRVINNFMIQGGDPNSKEGGDASQIGNGGPGYTIDAEFVSSLSHNKGALAAARQGDRVNPEKKSSGSQFYIVQSAKGTRHLNGSYTVFGQVFVGLDVVDKIAAVETDRRLGNRPKEDVTMTMTVKKLSRKKMAKMDETGNLFPDLQ
ncbi:peptidylprolyl isomerase [Pontibacter sp. G13]|uniref:peptidylprolyl isomerase n=1 Tax=Pontibacter sp. G13 TaxID=3074898 RepID=UPI00288A30F6|nr:peptidylprolyl isomerase [Pontibacter sp. G13]WNJ18523.1 peptidylprolyl isomerase [Pontibacter sp. G13]